jgi:hypothetical protein
MLHFRHYALIALTFAFLTSTAEARGRCDGFHSCRCGVTAARQAGLPYEYQGINLKQAIGWLAFRRTEPRPGAVGYVRRGGPTGHVFTVVAYSGGSTATVVDDAGTYERSIRGAVFVLPGER